MAMDTDARLDELEIRYAFQEDTIRQLSEVIAQQQGQLDVMAARISQLEGRLAAQAEQDSIGCCGR